MTASGALTGKVVVVSGGAGAIGGAVVDRCLESGATVHIIDAAGKTAPIGATLHDVDIADSQSVAGAFSAIVQQAGRIDAFVHAAGVSNNRATKQRVAPQLNERFADTYPVIDGLVGTDDADWRRLMSVNLDGAFFCLRAALRAMLPQQAGDVVMISSNAGLLGEAGSAAYSASKAGAQLLMQAAALEVVGAGIRVNAVAPGPTMTPLVRDSAAAGVNFLARVPARRVAEPGEIAAAVHFLLTENAGSIIGETINVNGGMLIR
jgi:3-oxoacyl-[acyl-carrier protein] reductase